MSGATCGDLRAVPNIVSFIRASASRLTPARLPSHRPTRAGTAGLAKGARRAKSGNKPAVDDRRDRLHLPCGQPLPRRIARAGRGGKRHGGLRAASGDPGRRRCPQARRQCRRCCGRRRLCAGRGLSGSRQSRRRRLHDDPARRRAQDLPRLPRDRAQGGDREHVSRQGRQRHQGHLDQGTFGRGRAGIRLGHGICAREIRHHEARRPARARDPVRRAGLRARPGRHRPAAHGHQRFQGRPRLERHLPQQRPAVQRR